MGSSSSKSMQTLTSFSHPQQQDEKATDAGSLNQLQQNFKYSRNTEDASHSSVRTNNEVSVILAEYFVVGRNCQRCGSHSNINNNLSSECVTREVDRNDGCYIPADCSFSQQTTTSYHHQASSSLIMGDQNKAGAKHSASSSSAASSRYLMSHNHYYFIINNN